MHTNGKKILIIAGEPSGDFHASSLVRELKAIRSDIAFFGMGGNLMRKEGVETVFDIGQTALVGLMEVLKNIFKIKNIYDGILSKIDKDRPDIAILVDYPGFNLRLAKELYRRSIPVIYYISPQVWAWGEDRIEIIKKYVEKVLVFFKFEEELYKRNGVAAEFIGHPLLDTAKPTMDKENILKKYALSSEKITFALLPGSRTMEVSNFLKIMVAASQIINKKIGKAQFIVARYPGLSAELYDDAIKGSGLDIKIASADTYNILSVSDFAIVASGTATLETAIIGTPLVIIYKANPLTYLLYKLVAKTKFLGLVNVISGKEVAPELLQFNATPNKIADKVCAIISEKDSIAKMREELSEVKHYLGESGAIIRAAQKIAKYLD